MTGKRSKFWLVLSLMAVAVLLWTTQTPATVRADTPGGKSPEGAPAVIQPATNPNVVMPWNLTENFDTVVPAGWTVSNQSTTPGTASWFQGNPDVFPAHIGATNAYAGVNFNSTTGNSTISNWLITPQLTIANGDTWSFWTRKTDTDTFPDRLEVRMSTNGTCSPGTGPTSVGDFTTTLTIINPTLVTGVYPTTWTQFTGTVSGLSGSVTGCVGFRYHVTNGGPSGTNSDYIGVDTVVLAPGGTGPTPTATATTVPGNTPTATATTAPGSTPTATATPGTGTGGQYCSTTPIQFVDNGSATGTVSVPDSVSISDLNMIITGTHTWVGDVTMSISNGTTSVAFIDRPGYTGTGFGCNGNNFPGVYADDEGTDGAFETSCAVDPAPNAYTPGGRYTPNNALSAFDGSNSAGTWTLTIADAAAGDTGSITGWCVQLNDAGPGPTATPTATTVPGDEPEINVTPGSFTENHTAAGQVTSDTMTIQNTGTAPLTWAITEENEPIAPVSDITDKVTAAAPSALLAAANNGVVAQRFFESGAMAPSQFGALNFTLDDGTAEDALGLTNGGQFIWFNRFTPAPTDYPFTLDEIQLLSIGTSGCAETDTVDFYVYQDADGNPANGATFVASLTGQTIGALDTLNSFPTNIALTGPGDVLIMAVNRTCAAAQQFPAAIDLDASQTRSWLGYYGGTVANPPVLPAPQLYGTVDSLGFPGNWLIRGVGSTGGGACTSASDIPWLTVSPLAGTTAAGGSSAVTLTYNSTGLANGTYSGNVCITSNDTDETITSVPVELTVGGTTAVDMSSFTNASVPAFKLADMLAVGLLVVAGAVLVFRRK